MKVIEFETGGDGNRRTKKKWETGLIQNLHSPGVSDSFDLTLDSLRVSFVESLFGELTMSYISFSSFTAGAFFLCWSCCFWSGPPSLGEGAYGGGDCRISGGREPAVRKQQQIEMYVILQRHVK